MTLVRRLRELFEAAEDEPLRFDERYTSHTKKKIDARRRHHSGTTLFESWQNENRTVIDQLRLQPGRPDSMRYFDECFTTETRLSELRKLKKQGKRIVGTFCNMVPEELIYAAGAIPLRLCSGCTHSVKVGEEAYPPDCCPLIKSSLGFAVADQPFFSLCDVVILPATCDGKKKLGEVLNDYKEVWMLELPQDKEYARAKSYWQRELRMLRTRLEKLTRRRIGKRELSSAIDLVRQRSDVVRRFHDLRIHAPPKISGCDAFLVIQSAFFDDIRRWTREAATLCDELEKKPAIKEHAMRLLVTGAPMILPNFKVPLMIEGFDAVIAMDETCAGSEYLYDPVEVDEDNEQDMMRAIAERYLMPSMCPCFIKAEDRIDKLMDMIDRYRIDGVVHYALRLCLLFDIESMKVRDCMEANGMPFLSINTDYSKEDLGQLRTRIEAFVEILHSRR